jgi:hypothetical protein
MKARSLPFALAFISAACGGLPSTPSTAADAHLLPQAGAPRCADAKAQSRPLIVDWDSSDRAEIEARARRGTVVVRADGCKLEVLKRCSVKEGRYDYLGLTPKTDRVVMRDSTELYANVPVYAAKLEGKLAQRGSLEVAMVIVGQWDSAQAVPSADQLQGECTGATHVVTALTVGAFQFSAGKSLEAGAEVSVGAFGGGAKKEAKQETLNRDGDEKECGKASSDDARPPFGCGAVLRVEVVPLGAPRKVEPSCAAGTSWDGDQCVAVKAGATCAEGMVADKERGCVPKKAAVVPTRVAATAPATSRGVVAVDVDCGDVAACSARCDRGEASACFGLGGQLRAELRPGKPSDTGERASGAFQKACDGGAAGACTALGEMRFQGLGVAKDAAAALALFQQACEKGDDAGCNDAGIALSDKGDHAVAAGYFERVCGPRSALGCIGLGIAARDGKGRTTDKALAREKFKKACSAGVTVGCKLASSL